MIERLLLAAVSASVLTGASAPVHRYAEGQVWEYQTRAGDEGSLLKIQKIETVPELAKTGAIYHVSIIGVHFGGQSKAGQLQHAPFSKASLDASVTKLSRSTAAFPDATGGIAEWKEARGGVFTITVADAVTFVERTLRQQMPPQQDVR